MMMCARWSARGGSPADCALDWRNLQSDHDHGRQNREQKSSASVGRLTFPTNPVNCSPARGAQEVMEHLRRIDLFAVNKLR
jgi:hypothetical protein